jgi:hypothetical protein
MSEQELTRENKPKRDEKGRLLPGNTANPAGRPEGSISVVSAIKKKLQECPEGKQKTYLHYLVEKIMKKAVIDDDVSMIKDIIDRVDGKPQQRTDITTDGYKINPMSYEQALNIIGRKEESNRNNMSE